MKFKILASILFLISVIGGISFLKKDDNYALGLSRIEYVKELIKPENLTFINPANSRVIFSPYPPSVEAAVNWIFNDNPGPSQNLFDNPWYTCSRNFYITTTGNDSTGDGSAASPWKTIKGVAEKTGRLGGDCINIAPGTYNESNITFNNGGSASTPNGYVVYRCQVMGACHIKATSPNYFLGIALGGSFIVFDGLEIDGNSDTEPHGLASACVGTGDETFGSGNSGHHVWVMNSTIHHCNMSGINLSWREYYYSVHNTLYHNSWTSGYQGSGIAYVVLTCIDNGEDSHCNDINYSPNNMDTSIPWHNLVVKNITYDNRVDEETNEVECGNHTDGNGIIMDTFFKNAVENSAESNLYPHRTLVFGNLSYNNGGRGIHIFAAPHNDVVNNTLYANSNDYCDNAYYLGDMSSIGTYDSNFVANVVHAVNTASNPSCACPTCVGGSVGGDYCGGRVAALVAGNGRGVTSHNNLHWNNIYYGASGIQLFDNDSTSYNPSNNKTLDPKLKNPGSNDFTLDTGSPALNYGYAFPDIPSTMPNAGAY